MLNHDLRAAMSDVLGGLRLIDAAGLTPELRAQIDRVRSSGEVLARLLEETLSDLYDAQRIVEGSGFPNLNLERFIHDLEMRWSGRATANKLSLDIKLALDLPPVIQVDRMALDRILSNLLGNAIKYAGQIGVQLEVDLLEDDELRMRISDDGPGFSDDALAKLFEFAGRPQCASKPGTGLGLHIAKDLADKIGGQLCVANARTGGAVISLTLPRGTWKPPQMVGDTDKDLPDLRGAKILVAEDNETNQLLTTQMLDTLGAEFEIAPDGVEALHWLEREAFDLALIDIEMPRLNGIETIRSVRAGPGHEAKMPLVALTGYVLKSNRDAIYAAGADGIIAKPIMSIETFGRAIREYLDRSTSIGPNSRDLPPPSLDTPIIDCTRMNELIAIAGPDTSNELLNRLKSDMTNVKDGLERAGPIKDSDAIRAETHVLISLSGAIGAVPLYHLATSLNAAAHQDDAALVQSLCRETTSMVQAVILKIAAKQEAINVKE
jgi:two-component system, OmpR family, aerobic respiration control sensor histidine kinase ArcB